MNTPHSVVQTMRTFLDSWQSQEDCRAIFLTCYSMMTNNMLVALEAGEFEDQQWVEALVDRFAHYYFEALHSYDTNTAPISSVWHFTFEVGRTSNLHVIQHLLLGINAHICYDLVFTLVEQMEDWRSLTQNQRTMRYQDHCHVNEIIFRTINQVQEEVIEKYCPPMGMVDDWLGILDEWLLHRLIVRWRDEVWDFATRLLDCADDIEAKTIRQGVEAQSLTRATAIAGQKGLTGLIAIF